MSCVLELLSLNELLKRKEYLKKELQKVEFQINKNTLLNNDSETIVLNNDSENVVLNNDSENVVLNNDSETIVLNNDSENVESNETNKLIKKNISIKLKKQVNNSILNSDIKSIKIKKIINQINDIDKPIVIRKIKIKVNVKNI